MGSEVERLREKVDSLRRMQEEKEKEVEEAEDMVTGNQGADGEFVQVECLSNIVLSLNLILGSDDFICNILRAKLPSQNYEYNKENAIT